MSSENTLFVERKGSGSPMVLAHGFAQNSACWGTFETALCNDHTVVTVDMPDHGRSPSARNLWDASDQLTQAGGKGTYIGYSFGARVTLHALLSHPNEVQRAVLISGTPGLRSDAERSARRSADEELASFIEAEGIEAFLDRWLSLPMFAGLSDSQAQRSERTNNTAAGLASSLRNCGTGSQENLWPRVSEIKVPVLLVTGTLDDKFTNIAEKLNSQTDSNVSHIVVDNAGHSVHLEQPDALDQHLRSWLKANPI